MPPTSSTHPDELALQAWLESPADADPTLASHLLECPHCQQLADRYRALNSLLTDCRLELIQTRVPQSQQDALLASILDAHRRQADPLFGGLPNRLTALFGSFVLVCIGSSLILIPRLARLDPLGLDPVGTLKALGALSEGLDIALPILLAVAEPLRMPMLFLASGMALTLAWLLSRRDRPLLLSLG